MKAMRLASSLSASCCPLRNWCSFTAAVFVMLLLLPLVYSMLVALFCSVTNTLRKLYGAITLICTIDMALDASGATAAYWAREENDERCVCCFHSS